MALELLGGIGVFLLGMVLLTDGLKAMAGSAVRRALARFTGRRLAAVATGAVTTAVIQSSSATTMTTIGLVAAGLLPLRNAIGVLLGANLGTTSTAWIVAYFGLKLDITAIAMLAVAAGAFLRLVGRERWGAAGLPLAGFGLLFVGIGLMQSAMAGTAAALPLPTGGAFPLLGLLLLVGIGAAMTLIMQSSSAAVATTLTALAAGVIGLEQAAALAIGQNIGTTPKALLAALGATVAARRTAMAHVLFNLGTGALALATLPAFVWLGTRIAGGAGDAITLAAFHSLFNLVGVAVLLPALGPFTRLVCRLVPDRGSALTRFLSRAAGEEPTLAVRAARTTLLMCATELADDTRTVVVVGRVRRVGAPRPAPRPCGAPLRAEAARDADHRRHVSVLHALDHLQGASALLEQGAAVQRFARDPELAELRDHLGAALERLVAWAPLRAPDGPADDLLAALADVPPLRKRTRVRVLRRVAAGETDPDTAEETLDTLVWVQQFAHRLLRAVHHLREPAPGDEA